MRIKRGTSRVVVVIGHLAINVPRKRNLKQGVLDNVAEYKFYRDNKNNIFLMPTYLTLFGWINIQKAGSKLRMDNTSLWCQLVEMTNKETWCNPHVFANSDNFCVVKGRLKIVDYGSERIHDFLKKWSDKIYTDFDFSYDWEERKKQLRKERG